MDDQKRNFAVGLTAAIGIAGVLVMMLLFGDFTGLFARTYPITIMLPNAAGLHPGSRVLLNGIEIGLVDDVRLREPAGAGVEVIAHVRSDMRIPGNAVAYIEAPLLAGSPVVAMRVPPDEPADAPLPMDGTAQINGRVPTIASAFAQEMRAVLGEPVEHLERVVDQFESLSREWEQVGANINLIVEPRNVDDVQANGQGANLTTVLARTDRRLAEMEQVLAGLDRYVNDEQMHEDLRQTFANSRALTEKASTQVDALSKSVDENITALRRRYVALADDMSGAVGSMRELVDEAREGEGTVGRMVKDPQLYDNLNDAAERLQGAVDEMRLLMQRWRAEGVPLQVF